MLTNVDILHNISSYCSPIELSRCKNLLMSINNNISLLSIYHLSNYHIINLSITLGCSVSKSFNTIFSNDINWQNICKYNNFNQISTRTRGN